MKDRIYFCFYIVQNSVMVIVNIKEEADETK